MSGPGMSPDAPDFLDMLGSQVKVESYLTSDTYGSAQYGAATTYPCHVANKTSYMRGASGEQIVVKGIIWISCAHNAFTAKARLTLPDGSQPIILAIDSAQDETGLDVYTRVGFG